MTNKPARATSEFTRLLAPCGLYCGGCLAFTGGAIRNHARALRDLLGPNFQAYAERFAEANPVFAKYQDFADMLDYLAKGTCQGCREGGCLLGNCGVRDCALERGMDFCGQCPDFPCENPGLPMGLVDRWRRNGDIIRVHGPSTLLDLARQRPRYP